MQQQITNINELRLIKDVQLKHPSEVYDYLKEFLSDLDREYFLVLHLNSKNCVIEIEIVAIGTLNSTLVHPREIFRRAIVNSSNAIILVHNHPSGDPTPSDEDKEITEKLVECGDIWLLLFSG